MVGAFSPLEGFMDENNYNSVIKTNRNAKGLLFGLPIVFDSNNKKVIWLCFNTTFEELIQWITVMVLGSLAVVINQLLIYANILSSPPVNSMVSYIGGKYALRYCKILVS